MPVPDEGPGSVDSREGEPADRWRRRAVVEQAKGIIMVCFNVGEDTALRVLGRWSSAHDVELPTVAATLLDVCVPDAQQQASVSRDPDLRADIAAATAALGPPPEPRPWLRPSSRAAGPNGSVGREGD